MDSAFGPVPSRRLGRSLGINNIPPKRCSYLIDSVDPATWRRINQPHTDLALADIRAFATGFKGSRVAHGGEAFCLRRLGKDQSPS